MKRRHHKKRLRLFDDATKSRAVMPRNIFTRIGLKLANGAKSRRITDKIGIITDGTLSVPWVRLTSGELEFWNSDRIPLIRVESEPGYYLVNLEKVGEI